MKKVELEAGKKYVLLVPEAEMRNYDKLDVFDDNSIVAVIATDGGEIVDVEAVKEMIARTN